jgi:hypothetical protein
MNSGLPFGDPFRYFSAVSAVCLTPRLLIQEPLAGLGAVLLSAKAAAGQILH